MSLNHSIPLDSIRNARELGGYMTPDNKKIKRGVLLRTACLYGISDDDIRLLAEDYRLRHIVDFRMPIELPGAEDPVIPGAAYHQLNVIDPLIFSVQDDTPKDADIPDIVRSVEDSERIGAFDGRMYVSFLDSQTGKAAYAGFLRILLSAEPDRAVLWHCVSGKDRTGLAAMLLLSALGVDEETIIEDHLLTNTFNAKRIEASRLELASKGYDADFIEKAVLVLDAVDERAMRIAIAHLKKIYGSVVGYICDGLGISQEEIDYLKNKYLI